MLHLNFIDNIMSQIAKNIDLIDIHSVRHKHKTPVQVTPPLNGRGLLELRQYQI